MDQDGIGDQPPPNDDDFPINFSDVIEVIQSTDPDRTMIKCVITEQPASKALRFRYECEGRCAGSIPGINSTPENKTFPSIKVTNYEGRAVVVVSCVTKERPYKPHPHNLVGREGCKKGVCTVELNRNTMSASFSSLGVQCVKKRDIGEALRLRQEIRVDPFRTGYEFDTTNLDLNAVRLCFQVFLESAEPGRFTIPLKPVVSDPIYDKKAMSDLVICRLSDCSCTVAGGKEIILLCEKVAKADIAVRFFEEQNGEVVWEDYGYFSQENVHKQVAIAFRTPKYRTLEVDHSIKCFIQLIRPSDKVTSEALPFEYLPLDSGHKRKPQKDEDLDDHGHVTIKRPRNTDDLFQQFVEYELEIENYLRKSDESSSSIEEHEVQNITDSTIKTEPVDSCAFPYNVYRNTSMTPSPQPGPSTLSSPASYYAPSDVQQNQLSASYSYQAQMYQNPAPIQPIPNHFNNITEAAATSSASMCDESIILPSLINNLRTTLNINEPPNNVTNNVDNNLTESTGGNLTSLFNMDSQNFTHMNSTELAGLIDGITNDTDTDLNIPHQVNVDQRNMTDTTFAINKRSQQY